MKALTKLANCNQDRRIKIRAKDTRKGLSLYLDAFISGGRQFKFLSLYLTGDKQLDQETIRTAILTRDNMETKLIRSGSIELNGQRHNFIDWLKQYGQRRHHSYQATCKALTTWHGGDLQFDQVNYKLVSDFADWLRSQYKPSTAWLYLSKLQAGIRHAIRQGIIDQIDIDVKIQRHDIEIAHLDKSEIDRLILTPCHNKTVKHAFIFSCFTGLRLSDIESIRWSDIAGETYSIRQTKTKEPLTNPLIQPARDLLTEIGAGAGAERIFSLPGRITIRNILTKWIKSAGIDKRITFHSARHSFAVIGLTAGADLYSISKLLGHKSIQSTQRYAKVTDQVKRIACDKISATWK